MNALLTLDAIRAALARAATALDPPPVPDSAAAVAAVLRSTPAGVEILFIRRAEHPEDPWSGDMGWPGGHVDAADGGPLAAAVRETREELALDLGRDGSLIGALPPVRTHLQRGEGPLWVSPFVFELSGAPELVPNHEVQEALWVPLAFLADGANRGTFAWTGRGTPLEMPCVLYEGHLIWGLTLRMLDDLLALVQP